LGWYGESRAGGKMGQMGDEHRRFREAIEHIEIGGFKPDRR